MSCPVSRSDQSYGKNPLLKALLNLKDEKNDTVEYLLNISEQMGDVKEFVNAAYTDSYYNGDFFISHICNSANVNKLVFVCT